MAERLADKVAKEEAERAERRESEGADKRKKTSAALRIAEDTGDKSRQISAKVNPATYAQFTRINKLQGLSNNSVLNMLLFKYVRENKGLLDDDEK